MCQQLETWLLLDHRLRVKAPHTKQKRGQKKSRTEETGTQTLNIPQERKTKSRARKTSWKFTSPRKYHKSRALTQWDIKAIETHKTPIHNHTYKRTCREWKGFGKSKGMLRNETHKQTHTHTHTHTNTGRSSRTDAERKTQNRE